MADPQNQNQAAGPVADAPGNWVDRKVSPRAKPYFQLARLDRPIGTWLLLWPCWWSLALAAPGAVPSIWLLVVFAVGALVMRGAGCTFNDLVDRDLDGQVARTAGRPLPSGAVSVTGAWVFLSAQCLVGLLILLSFNRFAILVGLLSVVLIAVYPFMKRVTYWPQLFLGLAFNWGALLGWAAAVGALSWAPVLLYLGGIFWTMGYDTIYAHQDKEDDALIGVKSTALRFGVRTKAALCGFYAVAIILFSLAGAVVQSGWGFWAILPLAAAHLGWQVWQLDIDDPANCLRIFRSNRDFGAMLFFAILAGMLTVVH